MFARGHSCAHWPSRISFTLEEPVVHDCVTGVGFFCFHLFNCTTWHMGISVAQPGTKPVSPALEGGVLTTGTPGQSLGIYMFLQKHGWNLLFQEAVLLKFYFNLYSSMHLFVAVLGPPCCVGFFWLQRAGAAVPRGVRACHGVGFPCCGAHAQKLR